MNKTGISWTDFSSNPLYVVDKVTGKRGWFCEKVSPGCAHCYASALNVRRGTGHAYLPANREKVEWRLNEGELEAIEQRRKPTRIFMCDMTDLFHEDVPDAFIDRILYTMETAPHHTFQVLTKRPARMRRALRRYRAARCMTPSMMPNVHLGVSVENQRLADERIPVLLDTPATVRFLSCEPLLGPLDLTPWLRCQACGYSKADRAHWGDHRLCPAPGATIDWVIVGGESGPGSAERKLVERCGDWENIHSTGRSECFAPCPMCSGTGWLPKPQALEWVRSLRDQCVAAGVPFFFKQWAGPRPSSAGALIDGKEWRQMP